MIPTINAFRLKIHLTIKNIPLKGMSELFDKEVTLYDDPSYCALMVLVIMF